MTVVDIYHIDVDIEIINIIIYVDNLPLLHKFYSTPVDLSILGCHMTVVAIVNIDANIEDFSS